MTEFEEFLKEILLKEKDKHDRFNIDKIEATLTAWGYIYRLVDSKDCYVMQCVQFKYRGKLTKVEEETLNSYGNHPCAVISYCLNDNTAVNSMSNWFFTQRK